LQYGINFFHKTSFLLQLQPTQDKKHDKNIVKENAVEENIVEAASN